MQIPSFRAWSSIVFALFLGANFTTEAAAKAPRTVAECGLYAYAAHIVRVVDGDTVIADIALGFDTWRKGERLRLAGIDTPELRGSEAQAGREAKEALRQLIAGRSVTICTDNDKRGKFGRYIAWIFADDAITRGSINAWLLRAGYARPMSDRGSRTAAPKTPPDRPS